MAKKKKKKKKKKKAEGEETTPTGGEEAPPTGETAGGDCRWGGHLRLGMRLRALLLLDATKCMACSR